MHQGIPSPSFIATADVHLGKKLYNMPELEEDAKDNLSRLVDLAIEKKVQYVVVAGDLFEDNFAKPHIIAFVGQQVRKLAHHGIRMTGIAGDHDKPLKGESWYRISGLQPVQSVQEFTGIDYFDYSSVSNDDLMNLLKEHKDPAKIQWIFLHCQFPQLFDMAQPKKLIDFNRLALFETFPNLQGIIAGDLHFGPETKAYGVGHEAYVGYTGSLGFTDIADSYKARRVLYCDGKALHELPFPQRRKMIKVDFRGAAAETFDVNALLGDIKEEKFKPLLYVIFDKTSDAHLHKLFPLYEAALVKMRQVQLGSDITDTQKDTTDRTTVSTDVKIEKALRSCVEGDVKDEDLIQLTLSLITSAEPRAILDNFKAEFNI